jgi:hypothetical protein
MKWLARAGLEVGPALVFATKLFPGPAADPYVSLVRRGFGIKKTTLFTAARNRRG